MFKEDVPYRAIELAAKFGFLSNALWKEFFVAGKSRSWSHMSWQQLLRRRYFVRHKNSRNDDIFLLNLKRGQVKSLLRCMGIGEPVSAPYNAVFRHDEAVVRGVMRLQGQDLLASVTSEAELKCQNHVAYKLGKDGAIPKYPDAILKMKYPKSQPTVAVEVELTQKSLKRYAAIMSNYSHFKDVSLLLFVIQGEAIKESIRLASKKSFYAPPGMKVGFMKLADWEKDPLRGLIEFKDGEKTLADYLNDQAFFELGKAA